MASHPRSSAVRSLVVCALALGFGCEPPPPTPIALPDGVDLAAIPEAQRALLRATLAIDDGVLDEAEVVLDVDAGTLSGDLRLNNVGNGGTHRATLRLYGRVAADAAEVVIARADNDVDVAATGAAFLDFDGVAFDTCAAGVDGACAVAFDANRNGTKNLDDLIAGVDPAPQAPFLSTNPQTLQFASGVRTGQSVRQVVVVENTGPNPVRVRQIQVAGGQGVGASLFDPENGALAPPRRVITLENDSFVIQSGDEAFIAVTFSPQNAFLTTAALQITAVDVVTGVAQAGRTKVIANADGALRPRDLSYIEPALDDVTAADGSTAVAVAFPAAQLFSGAEVSNADSADAPGLKATGQSIVLDGQATGFDAAFVVDVAAGARFAAALSGLASDVDVALVDVDESGALGTTAIARSQQAGTSAEAVELLNTNDAPRRVAVVLGRVDAEAVPVVDSGLAADERAPFRLSCQVTRGPELDDVDPVSPTRAALEGGISVTLHGRGFFVPQNPALGPHVRVTFDGVPVLGNPRIVTAAGGAQTLTVTLPPGSALNSDKPIVVAIENPSPAQSDGGDFAAAADGQAFALADAFRYDLPTPRITSVTPDTAADAGGGTATITGAFFFDTYDAPVVVFDGDVAAAVSAAYVDASTLTFSPPPRAAGTVRLSVHNEVFGGGLGAASNSIDFTFERSGTQPTLTSLDVVSGPSAGGTAVTLAGSDFEAGTRVFFGTSSAVSVNVRNSSTIDAVTPAGAGVVDVIVQNAGGRSSRLAGGFTYVSPPPTVTEAIPARASVAGGVNVVVRGSGFVDGVGVRFVDGATSVDAANVIVASPTSLLVTTPAFGASDTARLVVDVGGQTATLPFTFFATAGPAPEVITLNPSSGDVAGGFDVVVVGTGFRAPTVVFGDSVFIDVAVTDAPPLQQLRVRAPSAAAGPAVVTVINDDGQTDSATFTFVQTSDARIVAVTPSVLHAEVPGDELFVFGDGFASLGALTASLVVDGVERAVTVEAQSDSLVRLRVTTPVPASERYQVVLRGAQAVTAPFTVAARAPNIARLEANGERPPYSILMIGDNLAGDRLVEVAFNGTPCSAVVADERIVSCTLTEEPADNSGKNDDLIVSLRHAAGGVESVHEESVADGDLVLVTGEGEGEGEGQCGNAIIDAGETCDEANGSEECFSCLDVTEPSNDTPAGATSLPLEVFRTHEIYSEGDIDYFVVAGPFSGTIEIDEPFSQVCTGLQLLDATNSEIGAPDAFRCAIANIESPTNVVVAVQSQVGPKPYRILARQSPGGGGCGDGVQTPPEQCDDGAHDGDGCSSACQLEGDALCIGVGCVFPNEPFFLAGQAGTWSVAAPAVGAPVVVNPAAPTPLVFQRREGPASIEFFVGPFVVCVQPDAKLQLCADTGPTAASLFGTGPHNTQPGSGVLLANLGAVQALGTELRANLPVAEAPVTPAAAWVLVPDTGGGGEGEGEGEGETACGNSVLDGNEFCDDGNVDSGDGCSALCQTEDDFVCVLPGEPCTQAFCQSVPFQPLADPLVVGPGEFEYFSGSYVPTSRIPPQTSRALRYPASVTVGVFWQSPEIAFVGLRSDGQPGFPADEPGNSLYLRLHNNIAVSQVDFGYRLGDGNFVPVAQQQQLPNPTIGLTYLVRISDDGADAVAQVRNGAVNATASFVAPQQVGMPSGRQLVLAAQNASVTFIGLDVCEAP